MRTHLWRALCLVLVSALACTSQEERMAAHEERAEGYFEQEKWSETKIELLNLLQLDPDNADAHYRMAETLWNLQDYAESIWQYKEAVRLAPENIEYALRYAQIAFVIRDYDAVLKQVDVILLKQSESVEALLLRGRTAGLQGRQEDELTDLDRVLEIDPQNAAALSLKAQVLTAQGNSGAAEAVLKRLVETEPSVTSYLLYGVFLSTQDRVDDALVWFEAAIEVAKDDEERTRARLILANLHLNRQDAEAAEAQLLAAREDQPDNAAILLTLAQFYAVRGEREKAQEMLEARIEKLSDSPEPLLVLADFHRRMGDGEQALEAANRALALDPKSETARLRKAEYLLGLTGVAPEPDAIVAARRLVEEVLQENPKSVLGLFTEAKLLLLEGRTNEAATRLRRVLEEQPSANAHVLLGTAYLRLGESELARGEFLQALQLDANNQVARTQLAGLYLRSGAYALAVQESQVALRQRPGTTQLLLIQAEALTALGSGDEALVVLKSVPLDAESPESLRLGVASLYRRNNALPEAQEVLEGLPDHAESPAVIAEFTRIELQRRNPEGALALLDQAIARQPGEAKLYELRGGLYRGFRTEGKLKYPEKAERDLKTAFEKNPARIEPLLLLAAVYRDTDRPEDAIASYKRALEVAPNNSVVYLALASQYESLGRLAEARENYESALRLDPDQPMAQNNLAWLLADAENPSPEDLDRALELAQDAKERMPRNPSVADTLGWVMHKKNLPAAAISLFQEAIQGYPEGSALRALARYHLAQTYTKTGESKRAISELEMALAESPDFPKRADAESLLNDLRSGT